MSEMFRKWESIESFSHVMREINRRGSLEGSVFYQGKPKLHGTNAGFVVRNGVVIGAQKRSGMIDYPREDNVGFGAWVHSRLSQVYRDEFGLNYTVFGEWCGPGVQKGVAASMTKEKFFAAFAIALENSRSEETGVMWIFEPKIISEFVSRSASADSGIYVLPWVTPIYEMRPSSKASIDLFLERVNADVEQFEREDPWVKSTFGVSGIGEGLVYYAVHSTVPTFSTASRSLMFKAKGEKHRVTKSPRAATTEIDVQRRMDSKRLAETLCTDARLEQGAREVFADEYDPNKIGAFIAWITDDVFKECAPEIAAAEVDTKVFQASLARRAAIWAKSAFERAGACT